MLKIPLGNRDEGEHHRKARVKAGGLLRSARWGTLTGERGSSLAEMGLQPLLFKIFLSLISTANPVQVTWCSLSIFSALSALRISVSLHSVPQLLRPLTSALITFGNDLQWERVCTRVYNARPSTRQAETYGQVVHFAYYPLSDAWHIAVGAINHIVL